MNTSIQSKTIRPGSLRGYSYYYSGRPARQAVYQGNYGRKTRKSSGLGRKLAATAVVLAALIVVPLMRGDTGAPKQTASQQPSGNQAAKATPAVVTAQPAQPETNHCANNTQDKLILISITQRHLWACEGSKTVHDTPVITGMLSHPETLTPPGTYHVYAKQTNTTLKGSDSTGSWNRPVHYWMPFLDNEHGTYGFHDATWRTDNEFGNVDPGSAFASHGCVELPLASQKWLYDWAPIRTTVTVES